MSGRALVGLADAYVQALNAGAAPTIETAWRNVMVQQAAEARSEALDHYNDAMAAAFPVGDDSVCQEGGGQGAVAGGFSAL